MLRIALSCAGPFENWVDQRKGLGVRCEFYVTREIWKWNNAILVVNGGWSWNPKSVIIALHRFEFNPKWEVANIVAHFGTFPGWLNGRVISCVDRFWSKLSLETVMETNSECGGPEPVAWVEHTRDKCRRKSIRIHMASSFWLTAFDARPRYS